MNHQIPSRTPLGLAGLKFFYLRRAESLAIVKPESAICAPRYATLYEI